jgi:hypothetical protein
MIIISFYLISLELLCLDQENGVTYLFHGVGYSLKVVSDSVC